MIDLATLLIFAGPMLVFLPLLLGAISVLVATDTETIVLNGQKSLTGTTYSPIQSNQTIQSKVSLGTSAANAAVGGSDEAASFISSVGTSASVSIDLTALTDIMGTASVSLARVKAIIVQLLSAAQDSVNGTPASAITIDGTVSNALLSSSGTGWLTNATSKFDVPNAGTLRFSVGNAAGVAVSGTVKIVKITNQDASNAAAVQTTFVGGSS